MSVASVYFEAMDSRDHRAEKDTLPPWVLDPGVRRFLEYENIELTIIEDEKYRSGKCGLPLVVLRGMRPAQYYISMDAPTDNSGL